MLKGVAEPATMAEVKPRCRLYLQLPAKPSAKLEAQLAEALASADAVCLLLRRREPPAGEGWSSRLIDLVQSRGVAFLVADDSELAERLGSDRIHLGVCVTLRHRQGA